MQDLKGKNVVITGAGSGIGLEMALGLAWEGANLALLDINGQALQRVQEKIKGDFPVQVITKVCDLGNREAVENVVNDLFTSFFRIDILINNAGIVNGKFFLDTSYEEMKETFDVNLLGLMWLTRLVLKKMAAQGEGQVVNIASAAGMLAIPRLADYCASKFAVIGFSDALRLELKKMGYKRIKVTCVCPSIIDTGMFEGFRPPLLNPMLLPAKVAESVILAIKKRRSYVKMPFMVKLIPLFRAFPAPVIDFLAALLGVSRAMDHFHGCRR